MNTNDVVPNVSECPSGFLATTPRSCSLRVGVVGATREEAEQRFSESMNAWARLAPTTSPSP